MKLTKVLQKNFKLLFRNKTSLFTIFFGPLLIILILGLAFSSADNTEISIGYVSPGESLITNDIITLLNEKYLAKELLAKEMCIDELEEGILHACIIFPEDMNINNNNTNNIVFVVDKSRISLVYSVIEKISEIVDLKTDELSRSLTTALTDTLSSNNKNLDEILALTIKVKSGASDSSSKITTIQSQISNMKLNDINSGFKEVGDASKSINTVISNLTNSIETETDKCYDYLTDLRTYTIDSNYTSILDGIETSLDNLTSNTDDALANSGDSVSDLNSKINSLETKLKSAKDISESQIESLNSLKASITNIVTDAETIKTYIINMQNSINKIEVKSSDTIVQPITTTIETISGDQNKLALIFPYALMLIIMFTSLLLSSTLVIVEKQSKAAFRTFTTPTRDEFFILTTYLTSLIVIMFQIIIILAVVSYFLTNLIMTNILVNSVILFLGISLFILLGMMMGYLLKSQQATNMATISIGAIMLFISNIIFPLESISPLLKEIAKYNPFVITSEMLRRSILFETELIKILEQSSILILYCVLFIIGIIAIQKISKSKYFNISGKVSGKVNKFTQNSIRIQGELIKEKNKLIKVLKIITDEEYAKLIKDGEKEFTLFLETLHHKVKNIQKLSREDLIKEMERNEEINDKKARKLELKLEKKRKLEEAKKIKMQEKEAEKLKKQQEKEELENKKKEKLEEIKKLKEEKKKGKKKNFKKDNEKIQEYIEELKEMENNESNNS